MVVDVIAFYATMITLLQRLPILSHKGFAFVLFGVHDCVSLPALLFQAQMLPLASEQAFPRCLSFALAAILIHQDSIL